MAPRILLVGDYPPPEGGISIHVQQLHRALMKRGWEARVLRVGRGGVEVPGVERAEGPWTLATRLFAYARAGWLLHVHTSGNNPKAWALASSVGWTARLVGAPCMATLHSGLLPELLATRPLLARLAAAALRPFDAVVAVSGAVADAVRAVGLDGARLEVLPAFCADEVQPGAAPPALAAIRRRRRPLLAFAHHPSPVYGQRVMLEAVAQLRHGFPELGVAMFGPGTEGPALESLARELGVLEHLDRLGSLDHPSALTVIAAADAFVRPTLADGDSVSVREALSLGVRCVASDASDRPEGTWVFRSGDAGELAARIQVALAAPARCHPQPDAVAALERIYACVSGGVRAGAAHPLKPRASPSGAPSSAPPA